MTWQGKGLRRISSDNDYHFDRYTGYEDEGAVFNVNGFLLSDGQMICFLFVAIPLHLSCCYAEAKQAELGE